MKKSGVNKGRIKDYWETRAPQTWYSKKKAGTKKWFDEIEAKRYGLYYEYIPRVAEFDQHRGKRVLEIGVGVGTDCMQYAKNGAEVYGIDLTKNAVEVTRRNLRLHGLTGNFSTCDAENLKFKDNFFDLVFSFGVLHHTPNPEKVVKEIFRVLKPGGRAIVMFYSKGWKHYLKRVFWHGMVKGDLSRMSMQECINKNTEVHGNSPLTYMVPRKELKRMFGMFAGVSIMRYRLGEYFEYPPYETWMFPYPIRWLAGKLKLERLLGENYIVKAVKANRK